MTTYTKNERKVFNAIATMSADGSVASIEDVVTETGIPAKETRGVIGSLVKKNRVEIDEFQNGFEPVRVDYWPVTRDGRGGFFWCDELTAEETAAEMIREDEVK
tara:strand:+ start:39 stop:350 length:312 start_codon:yes stop_codon:yes gene_type:complete